jgi:hypothetical protein
VDGGHQLQVLAQPGTQCFGEGVIVHRERNVIGQQRKPFKIFIVVMRALVSLAEADNADEARTDAERRDATQKFRCDVAVGSEIFGSGF